MRGELGPNSCRVCLEPSVRLQPLEESREEGEETPNEMLIQLLGVSYSKLNGHEPIPDGICKACKVELNMAYQFREKALRKQAEIESYCRDMGLLLEDNDAEAEDDVIVKEEDITQNEEDMFIMDDQEDQKNAAYLDVDANTNAEIGEPQEVLLDDIEYLDENYSIEMNPDQQEIVLETTSGDGVKATATEGFEDSTTQDMAFKAAAQTNLKVRRSKARRGFNSLRTSDGAEKGGYVCDVCGNFYEKRSRMLEHRRRHDAVFQYQCELCEAKFQVREQLRKHMYSHTGSKPFKCSYCSRQFYYESVLKSHENVHRGVKPYVCKVCDKAFAYAHSLSKHELIHTDIKLYRCDYCHKDFRLLHHMRQHEETKCHQNAVMLAENLKYNSEEQVELLGEDELREIKYAN
ncbi:zinc finger and SCAN domain-containing protein 31 [Drosophila tropicalis]|uniref:zinc finger and SCAN domain-containing protein 31 n=1 Tax=Drosophila tropicalis TaxID=46794 RepID=UPI0035AB6D91